MTLSFKIHVEKIYSENERLEFRVMKTKTGKPFAMPYTHNGIKSYHKHIESEIKKCLPESYDPKNYKDYNSLLTFLLPSKVFNRRDTTNMVKIFEDGMKMGLGIDDNKNLTVTCTKQLSDDNKEYVLGFIELKEV